MLSDSYFIPLRLILKLDGLRLLMLSRGLYLVVVDTFGSQQDLKNKAMPIRKIHTRFGRSKWIKRFGPNLITNAVDWLKTTSLYSILSFADYAATIDGATRVNPLVLFRM